MFSSRFQKVRQALHLTSDPMRQRGAGSLTTVNECHGCADSDCVFVLAGTQRSNSLKVTVSRKPGTATDAFSFQAAQFATTDLSNAPTKALLNPPVALSEIRHVKILGHGWDNNGYSLQASMGSSAAAATLWLSTSSVNARPISGAFGSFKVVLTVGTQHSSVSLPFSYDVPSPSYPPKFRPRETFTGLRMSNQPVTGSTSITLQGNSFANVGLTPIVRLGYTSCQASEWVSDTVIPCSAASGAGGSKLWHVTVGAHQGSSTEAVSYGAQLFAINNSTANNRDLSNSSRNLVVGSVTPVVLLGSGLGLHDLSPSVRFGGVDLSGIGGTASGETLWHSTTSVVARSVVGRARSKSIVVTAGSLTDVASHSRGFSYDAPSFYQVGSNGSFGLNVPSTGSTSVTILGVSE